MDWKDIDRIRTPGFALARRGYDKHEVDRFLARLADWLETDAATEIGQMAVTRKLEALQTREAADEYARQTRAQADADARRLVEEAGAEARETIEEGERRRGQVEAVIADLEVRRDDALSDLERLRGELGSTIAGHRQRARANGSDGERTKKQKEQEPAAKA
jgi:DivIVA domain-containing protein